MNEWFSQLLVVIAALAWSVPLARADAANGVSAKGLISKIDKLGANSIVEDLLKEKNKSKLRKVLFGIQSGDDQWLGVLSKLMPFFMASEPAMQFDNAASEALDKNAEGVLRSAAIINTGWSKLANISENEIDYPSRICGVFSADWDEETPRATLALKTIPRLKRRKTIVMNLNSPDVSDGIKKSCLRTITSSLDHWGRN